MPIAYSYIRFSCDRQARGDSLRRQTTMAQQWCRTNGYELDTSSYKDLGLSAFHGTHKKRGSLGKFLEGCRNNKISKGTVLLIEAVDRLSREPIDDALDTFRNILRSGVDIVTLDTGERFTRASLNDPGKLFVLIGRMFEATTSSALKSRRLKDKWIERRKIAGQKIITGHSPTWLDRKGDKWLINRDKVAIIRRIFKLALTRGGYAIAKQLNKEEIAPLGKSKHWEDGQIIAILRNRRLLGEYQPCNDKRQPIGDPITDYYPRVISNDLFFRVQRVLGERKFRRGRSGSTCACLFTGLWRDPSNGTRWTIVRRRYKDITYVYMYSAAADRGLKGATKECFPYNLFETSFLRFVRELKMADLGESVEGPEDELTEMSGKLAEVQYKIERLQEELEEAGDFSAGLRLLRRLEETESKMKRAYEDLKAKSSNATRDAISEVHSILPLLEAKKGDELTELRRRLKSRIAELCESIDVLLYSRNHCRCIDAQVNFHAGNCRQFHIWYSPANGSASSDLVVRARPKHDLRRFDRKTYVPMFDYHPF